MPPFNHPALRSAALVCTLILAGTAHAEVRTVGGDGACSHDTVQAAINSLPPGDEHEIRIASSGSYTDQAIEIVGRTLLLSGGYATCASPGTAGRTTLDGAGGGRDSVITITGADSEVTLENLFISGGDEVYDGYGGGIDFRGSGALTLRNTWIFFNYAGYGGGINMSADGGPAELHVEEDTLVMNNTAQFSGGGIRIWGYTKLFMRADNTMISLNQALGFNPNTSEHVYGYGGGLEVISPAEAYIGSPGYNDSGAINNNHARYGGGIAVMGEGDASQSALVQLYTTNAARPGRIHGNVADQVGGGVYLRPSGDDMGPLAYFCANDFLIDGNTAEQGSALYLDTEYGFLDDPRPSAVGLNDRTNTGCSASLAGATSCGSGVDCNAIRDNVTQRVDGEPSPGAAILVQPRSTLYAKRLRIENNRGAQVLRLVADQGDQGPTRGFLSSCLLRGNEVSDALIRVDGNDAPRLDVEDCTIAGNAIGGGAVAVLEPTDGNVQYRFFRSVIHQPDVSLFQSWPGEGTVYEYLLTNDVSLAGGVNVLVANPRFVDAEHGDYRLTVGSPGVDVAPAVDGNDRDLDGNSRDRDIGRVPDDDGIRDLGAYERQDLQPMLLNGEFRSDLRAWTPFELGTAEWSPLNRWGTGTGSVLARVPSGAPGADMGAVYQCVFLPGPGEYSITAGALSNDPRVRPAIRLYLRTESTGEQCDGALTSAYDLTFPSGVDEWLDLAHSPTLTLTEAEWTPSSSVAVLLYLRGADQATSDTEVYFDGVVLWPSAGGGDVIFADDFEL